MDDQNNMPVEEDKEKKDGDMPMEDGAEAPKTDGDMPAGDDEKKPEEGEAPKW